MPPELKHLRLAAKGVKLEVQLPGIQVNYVRYPDLAVLFKGPATKEWLGITTMMTKETNFLRDLKLLCPVLGFQEGVKPTNAVDRP